jgi:LL-H family phage holin
MDQLTFQVIELLVCFAAAVIVALIAKGLIPALKNTMTEDQFKTVKEWVQTFVFMAEQVFKNTSGADKKQIVTKRVKQILEQKDISMTEQQISDLIEAAVKGMKIAEGKTKTEINVTNVNSSEGTEGNDADQ